MNMVSLKFVCDRMKISRSKCWAIFGKGTKGLVSEKRILEILNAHTVNMRQFSFIPHDLMTLEEIQCRVLLDCSPIPHERLLGWVKNDEFKVPHIRFSSHLIRISEKDLNAWISRLGAV